MLFNFYAKLQYTNSEIKHVPGLEHPKNIEKYLPQFLLQAAPNIWATFLLKVYYRCATWMINHCGSQMRSCHRDSDWFNLSIKGVEFCRILYDCMCEIIKEQKTRQQDSHQECIIKTQMFTVVSELFCLYKDTIRRTDKFGKNYFVVHWKNHYHPSTILKPQGFVYWMFNNASRFFHFKFEKEKFVCKNTVKSCTTYNSANWRVHECSSGWKRYVNESSDDSDTNASSSSSYEPKY